MDEQKQVSHAVLAMEGRAAWVEAWDAAWTAADREAGKAAKRLASRSECRGTWSGVIMAAKELMLPAKSNEAIRIAWIAAWDAAIVASKASLGKRTQKKTVYYPPAMLAAAWNTTWKEAIKAVAVPLDKSEARGNLSWNAALEAARSVLAKNKIKGLPPLAEDQVLGDAAWAAVSCAVGNAEWNAAWDKALAGARRGLREKDLIRRVDWDKEWAVATKSVIAIVEKICMEDPSPQGRDAWDAAWAAAGDTAWKLTASHAAEEGVSWHSVVDAVKTELEKSRIEWDLSAPPKWDKESRARRAKDGRVAGAIAWNAAYRAEISKQPGG